MGGKIGTSAWLDTIGVLTLIIVFTSIGYEITPLGLFTNLIIVVSSSILFVSLLMFVHEEKIACRISTYFDESENEDFIEGIADSMPAYMLFLMGTSLISILLINEFLMGGKINSQIYGLVMDGFGGGIFLPRQRIQSDPGTINISNKLDGRDITDAIFGAGLLVAGFALQAISIVTS
ncbi:hypothetical protein [Halosimplex pelagicum]|uniref:Uncharacterized protein n=1 Tax=Halosimplex pelagicum TaxID=869886 RepID=A0A7D5SWT4_9EURY|nr:hypothetical protein [Halosimplex pelagicum]QLH83327.1 hypothetical protein HZS54_17545 [Halosimplex pelagicum]